MKYLITLLAITGCTDTLKGKVNSEGPLDVVTVECLGWCLYDAGRTEEGVIYNKNDSREVTPQ